MNIKTITNEPRRGCGFRKEGGLYLVSGGLMMPCGGLPVPLEVCPVCHSGIHPTRGWTWIQAAVLFKAAEIREDCGSESCRWCPVSHPPERAGLLWVGEKFYPTTEEFTKESAAQGVSRRVSAIPNDFEIGKTWVYFAHRKAVHVSTPLPSEPGTVAWTDDYVPGIFHAFRPTAIEYIVKPDDDEEKLQRLEDRGITLIRLIRTDDGKGQGLLDENAM